MSEPATAPENRHPTVALHTGDGSWLIFDRPDEVITCSTPDGVMPCLRRVEERAAQGRYVAGFTGYEAAPACDEALAAFPPDEVPLVWFGVFGEPSVVGQLPACTCSGPPPVWEPTVSAQEYAEAFSRIKTYIAAGDTYQVNYTFRLHTRFDQDPWEYFRMLCGTHPMPYAGYVTTGRYAVCSFSPELFLLSEGERLTVQPMKGTAPRGRTVPEDLLHEEELKSSGKERAENVMIVDMIRNDIGRIARNGTVSVDELCTVKRYRSVLQMVSTVSGATDAPVADIFGALFPCASIVGAPKVRASQIIRELETTPRHCYCGTVGWFGPGRRGCFNVAIRTLLVDRREKRAEFGTGSGIVWESTLDGEYNECLLKAEIVSLPQPGFELVETLLWTSENGYFLLDRHLDRLMNSAAYFQFAVDRTAVAEKLQALRERFTGKKYRVRLTVDREGEASCEYLPFPGAGAGGEGPVIVHIVPEPVDRADPFLFHKTTLRKQYTDARLKYASGDDLLFCNERGELTESTIGNIVVKTGDAFFTPPVSCGLLGGVFRASLIDEGQISEKVITINDLSGDVQLYRINSVRKWQRCTLVDLPERT